MTLAAFDKPIEGITAALVGIGSIVGVFMWSMRRKPHDALPDSLGTQPHEGYIPPSPPE